MTGAASRSWPLIGGEMDFGLLCAYGCLPVHVTITRFLYRVGFYLTILLTILLCYSLLATSYLSIISQAAPGPQ